VLGVLALAAVGCGTTSDAVSADARIAPAETGPAADSGSGLTDAGVDPGRTDAAVDGYAGDADVGMRDVGSPADATVADGGSDPAAQDVGAGDARAPDADPADAESADAARGDARSPDAQPPDAQPLDAQPLDAQPLDAQPLDAQPLDAQPLDAQPLDAQPPDAEARVPARFLALGDSYTIGQSVPVEGRWPVQMAARLGEEDRPVEDPEIIARTGWTTGELSMAMDARDPQGPYEVVSLLIGVNDQFRGGAPGPYRGNFRALLDRAIDLAGGAPCRVVVLSIPDYGATPFGQARDPGAIGDDIDAFNVVNREETDDAGAEYVDVTAISRRGVDEPALVANDGLHPSGAQYALWVEAAAPAFRTALDCQE
jgi:lysophospholipase L1-like esterase